MATYNGVICSHSYDDFVLPDGRIDFIGFTIAFGESSARECARGDNEGFGGDLPYSGISSVTAYTFGYVKGTMRRNKLFEALHKGRNDAPS